MTTKNSKVVGSLKEKNVLQKDLSYKNELRYNWKDKEKEQCRSFPAPNEGAWGC